MKIVQLFLLFLIVFQNTLEAQKTTVYLVRHAEKDFSNPQEKNPNLTSLGEERAKVLLKKLKNKSIGFIYSTNTIRTINTAKPLANALKIVIEGYDVKSLNLFAQKIKNDYSGKVGLIVGHSNTVLETIEALGAKRPISKINENEYDYLFKVTINQKGKARVKVKRFGQKISIKN